MTAVRVAVETPRLSLLNGFELSVRDEPVELPLSAQRVLAFLALHDRPLQRIFVAGSLWCDASESHANASLRTALWRLRRPGRAGVVDATTTHLRIGREVEVDLHDATRRARRLLDDGALEPDDLRSLVSAGELLPDWYEDWVLIERERHRQLRLHALEALCASLAQTGRFADAAEAGLAAVSLEPLRESAHRVLIGAHLSEGNAVEAIRQFRFYRRLLRDQLGLEPSSGLSELVGMLPTGDV